MKASDVHTTEALIEDVNDDQFVIFKEDGNLSDVSIGKVRCIGEGNWQQNREDVIEVQEYLSYSYKGSQTEYWPAWIDPHDGKRIMTKQPNKSQRTNPVLRWVLPIEVVVYNLQRLENNRIPPEVYALMEERQDQDKPVTLQQSATIGGVCSKNGPPEPLDK
jgi:hypothetical protein